MAETVEQIHEQESRKRIAAQAALQVLQLRGFKDSASILRLIGEMGMQALRPEAIVRLAKIQADMAAIEESRSYGMVTQ